MKQIIKHTMKQALGIIVATVVLAALNTSPLRAADALTGIKGTDDRLTMVSHEYPWSAVGRVNTETGGHCTGVLVGPKVAITAAHCLYDKRKQWFVPPSQVHFVAGYFRADDEYTGGEVIYQETEYAGHSVAERYFIPDTYQEGVPPTGQIAVNDWAFIMLADDIGTESGWFGIASLDRASLKSMLEVRSVFVQAGYSRDKKQELTAHINCPFEGFAAGLALAVHRCDAVPGDSGSPIFYFEDGLPVLVAIHVATTQNQQPVRGVAVPTATFMAGVREMSLGDPGAPAGPDKADRLPVETARSMLAHLGYTGGGPLEGAIQRFEELEGLEITGEISYNLIDRLVTATAYGR